MGIHAYRILDVSASFAGWNLVIREMFELRFMIRRGAADPAGRLEASTAKSPKDLDLCNASA